MDYEDEIDDHVDFSQEELDENNDDFSDVEIDGPPIYDPAEAAKRLAQPLADASAARNRLQNLAVGIMVLLALLFAGVSLNSTNNLSQLVAKRTPTLQYYACRDLRQSKAAAFAAVADVLRWNNVQLFEKEVDDVLNVSVSTPQGTDPTKAQLVIDDRQKIADGKAALTNAEATLDKANRSLASATDITAPKAVSYLDSLTPFSMTQCPALPVKN